MMAHWYALPEWAQYLTQGLLFLVLIASSAVALTKAGRSPYWALLMIVPYGAIVAVWLFAFCRWPKVTASGQD